MPQLGVERRRFVRVPVAGPIRWRSGTRSGDAEVVDMSTSGAGVRMPTPAAAQLGPRISLEIDVCAGKTWTVTENARLVRRTPQPDGTCVVGVEFPEHEWGPL